MRLSGSTLGIPEIGYAAKTGPEESLDIGYALCRVDCLENAKEKKRDQKKSGGKR
jgi:hypothetical protein